MSTFGATNKPGSCLWCGKKLRWRCHTEWKQTDKKPNSCGAKLYRGSIHEDDRCPSKSFVKNAAGDWVCTSCHNTRGGRRAIVSQKRAYSKPGDFGDGCFCGKNCGYRFGVNMANNGRRLQPVEENEKKKKGSSAA